MNIKPLIKILNDKEYQLYELLKLKKALESKFLSGFERVSNRNIKLKGFLLTKRVLFFYEDDILKLISVIEQKLSNNFSKFKEKGELIIIHEVPLKEKEFDLSLFHTLSKYNEELEKFDSKLIVQGSYADNTHISYSDIDLVIIGKLSKHIIEIKNRIENYLLKIDPLQHHGVFFININTFANYWQMELPISTLKKALVLSNSPMKLDVPYFFNERLSSISWVRNFINNNQQFPLKLNIGVFYAKYFISQLLLVPALLLASKGNYVYKRNSFELAKKHYSSEAWRCMEITTDFRERWNQNNINQEYVTLRENINIKKVKEIDTLTKVLSINEDDLKEFNKFYNLFINETSLLLTED